MNNENFVSFNPHHFLTDDETASQSYRLTQYRNRHIYPATNGQQPDQEKEALEIKISQLKKKFNELSDYYKQVILEEHKKWEVEMNRALSEQKKEMLNRLEKETFELKKIIAQKNKKIEELAFMNQNYTGGNVSRKSVGSDFGIAMYEQDIFDRMQILFQKFSQKINSKISEKDDKLRMLLRLVSNSKLLTRNLALKRRIPLNYNQISDLKNEKNFEIFEENQKLLKKAFNDEQRLKNMKDSEANAVTKLFNLKMECKTVFNNLVKRKNPNFQEDQKYGKIQQKNEIIVAKYSMGVQCTSDLKFTSTQTDLGHFQLEKFLKEISNFKNNFPTKKLPVLTDDKTTYTDQALLLNYLNLNVNDFRGSYGRDEIVENITQIFDHKNTQTEEFTIDFDFDQAAENYCQEKITKKNRKNRKENSPSYETANVNVHIPPLFMTPDASQVVLQMEESVLKTPEQPIFDLNLFNDKIPKEPKHHSPMLSNTYRSHSPIDRSSIIESSLKKPILKPEKPIIKISKFEGKNTLTVPRTPPRSHTQYNVETSRFVGSSQLQSKNLQNSIMSAYSITPPYTPTKNYMDYQGKHGDLPDKYLHIIGSAVQENLRNESIRSKSVLSKSMVSYSNKSKSNKSRTNSIRLVKRQRIQKEKIKISKI